MIVSRRTAILSIYREHIARSISAALPAHIAIHLPQPTIEAICRMFVANWKKGRLKACCTMHHCGSCGKVWMAGIKTNTSCPECGSAGSDGPMGSKGFNGWYINHQVLRKFIRALELNSGLLMPMGFPSKHYPRTFKENLKLHRLRSGRTGDQRTHAELIEAGKQAMEIEYKRRFRHSRRKWLSIPVHQWAEGGPKRTLLALAKEHGGVKSNRDDRYLRIKERYLDGASGREAIEAELTAERS